MNKNDSDNDINIIKLYIDAVINMRKAIKQYFTQKIRTTDVLNGLTYEMFQVLVYLWSKNDVNQQDIADAIQKNKASITPLVDNLCKRGLVTRTLNPDDRRNNLISLTPKGKACEDIFKPIQKEFYQLLFSESSVAEINHTIKVLNRLAEKALSD